MGSIAEAFGEAFRHWGITLPEEDVTGRRDGSICSDGWTINYHFGAEEGREYIEFFASHRMTNDTLSRIHDDGAIELLDCCQEFYNPDDPNGSTELFEHNRRFYARVKGLGLA